MKEKDALRQLLSLVTASLTFLLLTRTPVDADLWWHLRAGQTMWQQGYILLEDVFSHTRAGAPWVNAFWASEIFIYLLYVVGGYFSLTLFVSITGAATFYLISRRLKGNPFIISFSILLAAITAAPIWGPRPQVLSFFIVALLDYWLADKKFPRLFLVPLFVLWANIHGGWIWGFLLLIAHIAGLTVNLLINKEERSNAKHEIRNLLIWTMAAGLAIGINPNGYAIWKLPFQQVNVSMQIQEWLSPDFHRIDFHPFLWMIFLLLLASLFVPKTPSWTQIFKVIGFAYLTFVAQRNIALFAIVAAPLLADLLNTVLQIMQKEKPDLPPRMELPIAARKFFNALISVLLILAVSVNAHRVSSSKEVEKHYPVAAVNWLKSNRPNGPIFNSYNWGGYLTWSLREYPVFIDGRADLYGNEIINEWNEISRGTDRGLELLDEYQINLIFLEPYHALLDKLPEQEWEKIYSDPKIVIYQRIP
jgi:hypothetical protein